jgi:hypothetical protein
VISGSEMNLIVIVLLIGITLAPWVIARTAANHELRPGIVLLTLFLAQFANLTIGSYEWFEGYSPIGQWNALITWILIAIATYECLLILIVKSSAPNSSLKTLEKRTREVAGSRKLIVATFLYSLIFIFSTVLYGGSLLFTFFYIFISIALVIASKPNLENCTSLGYFGVVVVTLTAVNYVFGIESPDTSFNTKPEYALAPYRNLLWELFGLEERFRGAFPHPNTAAGYLSFSILIMLIFSSKKIKIVFVPIAYILIWLVASRTGQITSTFLILFYLMFIRSTFRHSRLAAIPVGAFVLFYITGSDTTGSGRTYQYVYGFNIWRENLLLGSGPIVTRNALVENSLLSTFMCFGILGGFFLVAVYYFSLSSVRKLSGQSKKLAQMSVFAFLISSNLEDIFSAAWGLGQLYIFLFCVFLNSNKFEEKVPDRHQSGSDR